MPPVCKKSLTEQVTDSRCDTLWHSSSNSSNMPVYMACRDPFCYDMAASGVIACMECTQVGSYTR